MLFAALLEFYGALGDAALGKPRGYAARKASAAVAFARAAGCDEMTCDALAFAGTLHAVGAIGRPRPDSWDVPVLGARRCERIPALPRETAEYVRAQAEAWDGTGVPDQLRWDAIPLGAQLLALADLVLTCDDSDVALDRVNAASGRSLDPAVAALFAGARRSETPLEPVALPERALDPARCDAAALFEDIAAFL